MYLGPIFGFSARFVDGINSIAKPIGYLARRLVNEPIEPKPSADYVPEAQTPPDLELRLVQGGTSRSNSEGLPTKKNEVAGNSTVRAALQRFQETGSAVSVFSFTSSEKAFISLRIDLENKHGRFNEIFDKKGVFNGSDMLSSLALFNETIESLVEFNQVSIELSQKSPNSLHFEKFRMIYLTNYLEVISKAVSELPLSSLKEYSSAFKMAQMNFSHIKSNLAVLSQESKNEKVQSLVSEILMQLE